MEQEIQSRKRKRVENEEETNDRLKRSNVISAHEQLSPKVTHTDDSDENNDSIDKLPDDAILLILSFLESNDLVNISRCNHRFYRLCLHKSLWQRVEAVCDGKEPTHGSLLQFLNPKTASLCFHKSRHSEPLNERDTCFKERFFHRLVDLTNLTCLSIENHQLSMQQLNLKFLPKSITELKLNGTQLINTPDGQEFFSNVFRLLPNLKIVDVSYCQWFIPYSLVALAKCPCLKVLRMVGCRNLREFIPYAGIACYYGFPSLETLDMRLTNVVDREVGCFNRIKSLKHIYLEKPENDVREDDSDSITDLCTTALGRRNVKSIGYATQEVVITPIPSDGGDASEHTLETLVIRNYPRITDITLKHAEKCLKSLKLLDITGSSCSMEQVALFRAKRPEVTLVHN